MSRKVYLNVNGTHKLGLELEYDIVCRDEYEQLDVVGRMVCNLMDEF